MIDQVKEFHIKFDLPDGEENKITKETAEFRARFLQEELDELKLAFETGNKIDAFDALLDIVYVAYGTALFMGITPSMWKMGMETVHKCNMEKVKVESASDSKRGSTFDVKKPDDWRGPEEALSAILELRKLNCIK